MNESNAHGNQASQIGWDIGTLPFVYAIQSESGNGGLPELLPFRLGIDERFSLFVQSYNKNTADVLQIAYEKGSALSGLMEDSGNGLNYANDFHCFIRAQAQLRDRRVLDIGCGSGYLLSRLKADGANVMGLEPGEHGQSGAQKYGVPILREYFPTKLLSESFDVIVFFAVLEHVSDPLSFLTHVRNQLAPKGKVALAVPNCGPYLGSGDVSCLFHEHWSYFNQSSLRRLLKAVFHCEPVIEVAKYGGSLYASVSKEDESGFTAMNELDSQAGHILFDDFRSLALNNIDKVWRLLEDAWGREEVVGIYVPWRAMNVLGCRLQHVRQNKIRFFDDNPLLHRTFYPGFTPPVESMDDLLAIPPDRLLVMSNTFGDAIVSRLRTHGLSIPIITWNDLFG